MQGIAGKAGIDIHKVICATATKPLGFVLYYRGRGQCGHCIPIDLSTLLTKAREYGTHTRFIEFGREAKRSRPEWMAISFATVERHGQDCQGKQGRILEIAYKRNVQDVREPPGSRRFASGMRMGRSRAF